MVTRMSQCETDPDYECWTIIEKLDPGESNSPKTPSYSYDDDDDDEYL